VAGAEAAPVTAHARLSSCPPNQPRCSRRLYRSESATRYAWPRSCAPSPALTAALPQHVPSTRSRTPCHSALPTGRPSWPDGSRLLQDHSAGCCHGRVFRTRPLPTGGSCALQRRATSCVRPSGRAFASAGLLLGPRRGPVRVTAVRSSADMPLRLQGAETVSDGDSVCGAVCSAFTADQRPETPTLGQAAYRQGVPGRCRSRTGCPPACGYRFGCTLKSHPNPLVGR
jgi:hypothetical protein